MTRYKGRTSFKSIELDAMYAWRHARGIQAMHGRGRREEGRDHVRWCFADANLAEAFAQKFERG
jgi:hypothetical protein